MPRFPSKPVTSTDLTTGAVTHYPSMYAAAKDLTQLKGLQPRSYLPGLSVVIDRPERSAFGRRWSTAPNFTPEAIAAINAFGDALERADSEDVI